MTTTRSAAKAKLGARLTIGAACVLSSATALADPGTGPETLDQAALLGARAPSATPVPDAQVVARYGAWLQDTTQKFPDLRGAIVGMDGAFFSRQAAPDANRAMRLADGTEVLLLSGCRNQALCSETGYLLGCDFAHRQVALLEVLSAGQPRSFLFAGSRQPALRALLLAQGLSVFAKAAPDPDRTALQGVKVSAATRAMQGLFQAKPNLLAAARRVYPGAGSIVDANDLCGVMMADGQQLSLISAITSSADGAVAHAIATDDKASRTFVYRADGRLGKEAWFGDPSGPLRTLLSVGARGCTALRGKLGLDPNGQETSAAGLPSAATGGGTTASPSSQGTGSSPVTGDLECRASDGTRTFEVFVGAPPHEGDPFLGSMRISSTAGPTVQSVEVTARKGMLNVFPVHGSASARPLAVIECISEEMLNSGDAFGKGCGPAGKQLLLADSTAGKWKAALTCQ